MVDDGRMEQISLRLPREQLKRAESLRKAINRDKAVSAIGTVTRSRVLQLALARGLEALEAEYS